jgi:hypothetical protein
MTTATLRAYHGQPAIKAKYLRRVRAHAKADEIVAGQYWENGKGCAVGCTLHSNQHAAYETELGIPEVLARLEDGLFERIYKHDAAFAKSWPEKFLKAPKPGADLSMVWPRFALWLLVDPKDGVLRFAKTDKTRKAINGVADLYKRWIGGVKPKRNEWLKARNCAYDAAYYAANAAYYAANAAYYAYYAAANAAANAANAAYDAAYDAANAAYDAAYDAANATDARREAFYIRCAKKLLALMKGAA